MKKSIIGKSFVLLIVAAIIMTIAMVTLQPGEIACAKINETKVEKTTTKKTTTRRSFKDTQEKLKAEGTLAESSKAANAGKFKWGKELAKTAGAVGECIALASNAKNKDELDYYEMLKSVCDPLSDLAVVCFPYGTAVSVLYNLVTPLLSIGEHSQSEIEALQQAIDDQFEVVNDNFESTQRDLRELSDTVNESMAAINESTKKALDTFFAKTQIGEFMSGQNGGFNYKQFKNYLYGSTDSTENPLYFQQAFNAKLNEAINNRNNPNYADADKITDEIVKQCYDNLYRSMFSTEILGDSSFNKYYSFLMSDSTSNRESIQHDYFDFLSESQDYVGEKSAEGQALLFAADLYDTALFADERMEFCNQYQEIYLLKKYGRELSDFDRYYFGSEDSDYIEYGDLRRLSDARNALYSQLVSQFVKDVAYILNAGGSFLVESDDGSGRMWESTDADKSTFGKVVPGQTLYLNKIDDESCSIFDFDRDEFSYKWYIGNDIVENDGKYQVTSVYQNFTAKVFYGKTEVYSIDFSLSKPGTGVSFDGGDGSARTPYLISNFDQLMLINDELDKNYMLTKNIDCKNCEISPLGDTISHFEGILDGNGYEIKNLNVIGSDCVGLFAVLAGTVKNLTLSECDITTNGTEEESKVYGAAFAGMCSGNIINCRIKTCEIKVFLDVGKNQLNKAIYAFAGGLAGELSGTAVNCSVESTNVTSDTNRHYESNSDSSNLNSSYAGGIAAKLLSGGSIRHCTVSGNVLANGKSYCVDNLKRRHPHMDVLAGGIVVDYEDGAIIEKVYSTAETQCDAYKENTSKIGGSDEKYVIESADLYFPFYGKEADKTKTYSSFIKSIKASSADGIGYDYAELKVDYAFDPLGKGEIVEWNEAYDCNEIQLYECGDSKVKTDGLTIKIDGNEIQCSILNYYNLNTANPNKTDRMLSDVEILFSALYNGNKVIGKLILPITVKENKPDHIEVIVPETVTLSACDDDDILLDGKEDKLYPVYVINDRVLSKGEEIKLIYQDGSSENIKYKVERPYLRSSGLQRIEFNYGGLLTCTYEIIVKCTHSYVKIAEFEPTCYHYGYSTYQCGKCGHTYYSDTILELAEHTTELKNKVDANCEEDGYTGDEYCTVCRKLLHKGEVIEKLPHAYENKNYDNTYHCCSECNTQEPHVFTSTENKAIAENNGSTILYTCIECGYQITETIDLTAIPRVVVSNGYVLPGKEVVVYIQILNNPGITGASCSIVYDEALLLLNCEQDTLLRKPTTFAMSTDRSGICNVTLARAEVEEKRQGNLLKLTFRAPDDAVFGSVYDINIANSRSEEPFTDRNSSKIDILTLPGTVTVVERLPGDVNGDGSVDILDSVLVAISCNNINGINDSLLEHANFDEFYADVDLSGQPGLGDITSLLRYLVGGYDEQVYAGGFELSLNPNDGVRETQIIKANCYDSTGKRYKYADLALPVLSRDGYRFDGWYTRAGKKIEDTEEVVYNKTEYADTRAQTLFAHWTLNRVIYDGNGATENTMSDLTYAKNGEYATLSNNYVKKHTINYVVTGDMSQNSSVTVSFTFLGWALTSGGNVVYSAGQRINMKSGDTGELRLYAVWEGKTATLPKPAIVGQIFEGWYNDNATLYGKGNTVYTVTEDVTMYARWNATRFSIAFDGNGGTGNKPNDISNIEYEKSGSVILPGNPYVKKGYYFVGWNTQRDGKGDTYIGTAPHFPIGGTVVLYVKWAPNKYKVVFSNNASVIGTAGNNIKGSMAEISDCKYDVQYGLPKNSYTLTGWTFAGWAKSSTGNVEFADKANFMNLGGYNGIETVTLYAVWRVNSYTIYYNANGGSCSQTSKIYNYGTSIAYPTPYRHGWVFRGWGDSAPQTMPNYNFTATAQWDLLTSKEFTLQEGEYGPTMSQKLERKITLSDYFDYYTCINNYSNVNITFSFHIEEYDTAYEDFLISSAPATIEMDGVLYCDPKVGWCSNYLPRPANYTYEANGTKKGGMDVGATVYTPSRTIKLTDIDYGVDYAKEIYFTWGSHGNSGSDTGKISDIKIIISFSN